MSNSTVADTLVEAGILEARGGEYLPVGEMSKLLADIKGYFDGSLSIRAYTNHRDFNRYLSLQLTEGCEGVGEALLRRLASDPTPADIAVFMPYWILSNQGVDNA